MGEGGRMGSLIIRAAGCPAARPRLDHILHTARRDIRRVPGYVVAVPTRERMGLHEQNVGPPHHPHPDETVGVHLLVLGPGEWEAILCSRKSWTADRS